MGREGNNPRIPAAYTYLGQFIDHDITFDPASSLQKRNDPDALHNFRTPAFDLDSVYGRGPDDQPYMFDGSGRFLIGRGQGAGELDLPRNDPADLVDDPSRDLARRALIGDPRNDENVLVSQLHLTMLLFHNKVMDHLDGLGGNGTVPRLEALRARLAGRDAAERFAAVQQVVRWHYQWVVVHDFLRRIVGDETFDAVFPVDERRGPTVRRPDLEHYDPRYSAFMPVEFSVAAYRFGHSMIRNRYRLNTLVPPEGVTLTIFSHDADPASPERLTHLGGFRQLPPFWPIEWRFFVDVGDAAPAPPFIQASRRIDTNLAFELPQPGVRRTARAMGLRSPVAPRLVGEPTCGPMASTSVRPAGASWPRCSWGCWPTTRRRGFGVDHGGPRSCRRPPPATSRSRTSSGSRGTG